MSRATISDAAYAGWVNLHVAAVRGDGAGKTLNRGGTKIVKVNETHYLHRTCHFPTHLGFAPTGSERYSIELAQLIAGEMIKRIPVELATTRLNKESVLWWLDLMDHHARSLELPGGFDVSTPFTAMKSAYAIFSKLVAGHPYQTNVAVDALVLLGIATSALLRLNRCERCFRWAIPGHKLCPEHSQSAEARNSRMARPTNYPRGPRAPGFRFHSPPRSRRLNKIDARRLPRVISRILWGTPLPDEERTAESIRKVIRSNPEVSSVLGHDCFDLQGGALYERLNERLDRYEFDPSAWVPKIKSLVKWLRQEALVRPARRGEGTQKKWRIIRATDLAREGFKQAEIAKYLGIRPSAISNWIRRGQAPELERLLAEWRSKQVGSGASAAQTRFDQLLTELLSKYG